MARAEITVHVADVPAIRARLQRMERVAQGLTDLADHLDDWADGRHAAVAPALRVLAAESTASEESA